MTFRAIKPQARGERGAQQTQQKSTRYTQTFHTNPTMSEEGECEEGEWSRVSVKRWLQKTNFNHPTRLGRLQARSGYIGPKGPSRYPGFRHTKLRILASGHNFSIVELHFQASSLYFPPSDLHFLASDVSVSCLFRFWMNLYMILDPFWIQCLMILSMR